MRIPSTSMYLRPPSSKKARVIFIINVMKIAFIVILALLVILWYRRSGYSSATGFDIAGGTLFTGQTNTECQAWCNKSPTCAGYVQYQNNTCQCKSSLSDRYQVNGATVYIK